MSGVDALGLALALLSMTVSVLDKYTKRIKSEEVISLCLELEMLEENYRNTVEELLGGVLSRNEVRELLKNPEGAAWRQSALADRLTEVLGDTSQLLFRTADRIKKTLEELKKHLPPLAAVESESHIKRIKKVIKVFYKGPSQKASLERCGSLLKTFQEYCDRSKRLAPVRKVSPGIGRPLLKLRLHQKNALALHDAIQNKWRCEHNHPHIAYLKLDMWNPEDEYPQFEFCFSRTSNGDSDSASQWRRADVKVLPSPDSPTGADSQSASDITPSEIIDDLCAFLESLDADDETPGACLGILMDEMTSQCFGIFCDDSAGTTSSTPLRDFESFLAGPAGLFEFSAQIRLAFTLSLNVLQLQSTHWLEEYWTSENIRLMSSKETFRPYVTHQFESVRRRSSFGSTLSLVSSQPQQSFDDFVRNRALFSLGIMLIELCYRKPINDLIEPKDQGSLVLTALRLVKGVERIAGSRYERIVRNCLFCEFEPAARAELADEQFQEGVYEHIVQPLKEEMIVAVMA